MARRMTYEGAKVKAVVELMPYSSGLNRNIVQCLNDYEIPLFFSHTIIDIKGRERISSVVIAQVDKNLKPILETAQEIKCDTLLLSVGLIPENELAKMAGVTLSSLTGGAIVDEKMMTNVEGIFACGNVLHVHDLVDFVSTESEETGLAAVAFLNDLKEETYFIEVKTQNGVRYTVPQKINKDDNFTPLTLKMRVSGVYRKVAIKLNLDGEDIYTKKKQIVSPGEMETINLSSELVQKIKLGHDLIVELEESE